ncbi:MAG: ATP-binding cassette domain-containing protein [Eggerthellaceae bacterium]
MNDLRIRSLSKHYDGFDLRNVDLTVPAGSVVGFIGSNGAGKTTTIKAILGLIYPDAGSIELLTKRRRTCRQASNAITHGV